MIELKDVLFVRQGKDLLKGINWKVNKGDHWAMMGLNGSGKTTLLNIIYGYYWATTGQVKLFDQEFGKTSIPDIQKRIGWVTSALSTRLNLYEPVERIIVSGIFSSIGIYQKVEEEHWDKVDQTMALLGIEHLKGKKFIQCSQGQQQFVLIARSLVANPELLILDEACNGLDLFATEQLLERVEALTKVKDGPTILFVTHHAEQITPAFNKLLLLKKGEIFDQGDTKEILKADNLTSFYDKAVEVMPLKNQRYLVYPAF